MGMSGLDLAQLEVHLLVYSPPVPRLNHLKGPVLLDSNFFRSLGSGDVESLPHLLRTHHTGRWNNVTPHPPPCHIMAWVPCTTVWKGIYQREMSRVGDNSTSKQDTIGGSA